MIKPLSSIVFYTVLLATSLFLCGILLHFQHTENAYKANFSEAANSMKLDLTDFYQSALKQISPDSSLPDNEKQQPANGLLIFSVCCIMDSCTLPDLPGNSFTQEELSYMLDKLLLKNKMDVDSVHYVFSIIGGIAHFGVWQKRKNSIDSSFLFLLDTYPVNYRLDHFLNSKTGPAFIFLESPDTTLVISRTPLADKFRHRFFKNITAPIKIFSYRAEDAKNRLIRIAAPLDDELTLFTFYSIPNGFTSSLVLIILSFLVLLTGTILFPSLFKKDLHKQIHEINKVVLAVREKDFDKRITEEYLGELGILTHSINQMSQQLKEVYHDLEIRVIRRTSEISMRNAALRTTQREILKQNNELKSAYEALKESREKYEKLIEHLADEYFFYSLAENGTLLFVSPSVKKILGYGASAYREQHNKLYTDNPVNTLARERAENLLHGISQPKYIKEIYDVNHLPKILEVSEVPVFNEDDRLVSVEGLAHDITERQKAEELIKEQEEKYRMLFNHASDFIFMYELDKKKKKVSHFIEANQYTIEKLGYSLEELRLKTPLELIAAELWDNTSDSNDEYLASDSKFERIWESKDGNIFDVEISAHAFKIREKHVAIAVARDISERKHAEQEVRFMNEELVNQKENLEALVDNLTQTQEQLVQSEKMAALGQLIAGIAHEVNTPLGAIKASIGNLSDSLDNALGELPALFQTQSLDNLKLFTQLFDLARHKHPELSSREKRQKKRELSTFLMDQQIQNADMLADLLIYLEIYETDNKLLEGLRMTDAIQVVKSARNFISLLRNTNTINIAVEKATKVVFALKKYAHRDAIGEKASTDLIDNIETVLTLYHNQLKQGVEVIRNYEKLPLIPCYQDEISQVWTNLISNAIQAMHLEGTLTISTHMEKDVVWITFKDDGPGIEPDIIDKIFEPFFTTKKQGEGSGLGLDIVKKIIDKHNGTIEVESKLGEGARFIIKIPAN
jgi:two-component system, NtrC family, sensor kinase